MTVIEDRFTMVEALGASEMFVMSSTRGLLPVSALGDKEFDAGDTPMLDELRAAVRAAERRDE